MSEAKHRVSSDRTLAIDDLPYPVRRHIDLSRELGRCHSDFRQFFLQYPTGIDGTPQHPHSPFMKGSPQVRHRLDPIAAQDTRSRFAISCLRGWNFALSDRLRAPPAGDSAGYAASEGTARHSGLQKPFDGPLLRESAKYADYEAVGEPLRLPVSETENLQGTPRDIDEVRQAYRRDCTILRGICYARGCTRAQMLEWRK